MWKIIVIIITVFPWVSGCMKDSTQTSNPTYSPEVEEIISTKCSTSGCHNSISKDAAGGLSLSTWDELFMGGNGGSVVIPYRPDQSWLMYYINTDTSRGVVLTPTMPFNQAPLSDAEYNTLQEWISAGAPNAQGEIAFSGDPDRKKFYVANQGCDLVSVFDTKSLLAMRYVDVGTLSQIEIPHNLKVSSDGQYWYVCFVAGTVVQKFRTSDDTFVGQVEIGSGSWNTMTLSPDGTKAFVIDFEDEGKIAYVNLENLSLIQMYQGSGVFASPHGSCVNNSFTILYVTSQFGNFIYKIDITNPTFPQIEQIVLVPGQQPNTNLGTLDPHEIALSPDETKYFVTCNSSNEVRVMDAQMDTLISVIPVGQYPVEMVFSKAYPYLFVTCMEDPCAEPLCKGSVWMINYIDLTATKLPQSGLFEPHGITVDDDIGVVVIANRNVNPDGPAPHHSSDCGGRNGYLKFIDLSTLQFITPYRPEVSVDPYSVAGKL
jgi:YVTN family beta-propeller protein